MTDNRERERKLSVERLSVLGALPSVL